MLDIFHASQIRWLPNECRDSSAALDVSLRVCAYDTREHMHALKWISSLAIRLHAFLICLQVRRRKHVMRFPLNPTIIFVQSRAAHYLMVHRNSSMPTVEIVLPDTVHTQRRARDRHKEWSQWLLSSTLLKNYLKFSAY